MTTVTLHAGTVGSIGTGTGSIVGSGAVWDDADDATYTESWDLAGSGAQFYGLAPLDVLTLPTGATVNSVTVNFRAALVSGSLTPTRLDVGIFDSSFSVQVGAADGVDPRGGVTLDGTITDYVHTFTSGDFADWGSSLSAIVSALQAGAQGYARTFSNSQPTGSIVSRTYELSIDVDYDALTPPSTQSTTGRHPLRQWPPPKGAAVSARRVWPRPSARRVWPTT